MTPIVEFRKFSSWYGDAPSLQEITLQVPPNEILGVIGPAGGGKTTLLRSLNRMNDFDPRFRCQGDVLYHGVDLYRQLVDVAVLRRKMGMVFAVPVFSINALLLLTAIPRIVQRSERTSRT